ncbi:MAG: hypothetical protein NZZ60_09220 [Bacteroidia bacterium]|nr:hypothetical protein [Bacteroidia bacterium]MDW8417452.1 hypothetical protein [Bacteroidia bacterium]
MRCPVRLGIWLTIWSGTGSVLYGQRIDTILPPNQSEWKLPEGWLLPNSVIFDPPRRWRYDTTTHSIRWEPQPDTVRLRVQIVPLPREKARFTPLPWSALEKWDSLAQSSRSPPPSSPDITAEDTFTPKINRSGSLIRSLTVGTGQNATLNSAFRLNLEGKVAPDLYIIAALTDENLPFQTAATQSLADFDRVNIGLRWRKTQLLLGDLELKESRTHFANFYRNVLGIELRAPLGEHKVHAAFAEAKGQFHTNSFMGQEGRQGPYPLTGKNGERFIPILAGSEKVYVNGVLMQRGQDRDYVIDYTVGEITFTPRIPITAATRIVVDFEYADRSYGRSFIWLGEKWQGRKLSIGTFYFRQADNPRRPLDFTLAPAEEELLSNLPPGSQQGLLRGIDTLPYEAGSIRYAARDTMIEGQRYQYFVVSQNPQEALYQVSFVFVGAGRGEYIREPSSLNGNAFRWVGMGQGEYIIGRAVPLPKSIEVLSLQYSWQVLPRFTWEGEIDGSRYVENRFARRSIQDVALRHTLRWRPFPDTASWWLSPEMTFQYVGAGYQNADRVYAREYGRYWNYNDLTTRQIERLVEGRLALGYRERYRFTPSAGWRSWGDSLRTLRTAFLWEGTDTTKGIGGTYLVEYIPSYTGLKVDRWWRHSGRIFYTRKAWQLGTLLWTERRRSDLIDTANFRFHEYTPYIRYSGEKWSGRVAYQWRYEWQSLRGDSSYFLRQRFRAFMPQIEIRYQGQRLSVSTITSYRWFEPGDTAFGLVSSRNLLSQNSFRLRWRPWDVEGFYQLSSEQTPQRQILFVAVNPGQGTHEWRDLNADGLQQIEEFIPAINPLLANYIRIQRATGRFIPTIALSVALTFRWQPEKRLRWLSYQANTRLEQRQNAPDNRLSRYLPSPPPIDTSFLQWTLAHRQDIFLFRQAIKGDQIFSFQYQLTQLVPLSGLQRQVLRQYSSRSRYNFTRRLGGEMVLSYVEKSSLAPAQRDMNYTYEGVDVYPQLIYQPSGKWRTTVGIAYRERRGRIPLGFRVRGGRLSIEQRWSWKAGALVNIRLEPALYGTRAEALPSLLLFDLLEGMQIGRNLFCGVTISFPLSRYVELSVLYEGRISERAPIHSARMQARANF